MVGGERAVWQQFWEHPIRDGEDFAATSNIAIPIREGTTSRCALYVLAVALVG